eukprot:PhM_4_TR7262/c0_g1_i1/m.39298
MFRLSPFFLGAIRQNRSHVKFTASEKSLNRYRGTKNKIQHFLNRNQDIRDDAIERRNVQEKILSRHGQRHRSFDANISDSTVGASKNSARAKLALSLYAKKERNTMHLKEASNRLNSGHMQTRRHIIKNYGKY